MRSIVQTIAATTTPTQDDQQAIREIRQLLQQARHTTYPGPHQLATLNDLHSLANAKGITAPPDIKTAC